MQCPLSYTKEEDDDVGISRALHVASSSSSSLPLFESSPATSRIDPARSRTVVACRTCSTWPPLFRHVYGSTKNGCGGLEPFPTADGVRLPAAAEELFLRAVAGRLSAFLRCSPAATEELFHRAVESGFSSFFGRSPMLWWNLHGRGFSCACIHRGRCQRNALDHPWLPPLLAR